MAEEEKTIELPDDPVEVDTPSVPPPKKSKHGMWAGIGVGIGIIVLILAIVFVANRDKGVVTRNSRNFNNTSRLPILNARTISSNTGYGGNFNGSRYTTSI
jgi:hypothetical protein